MEKQNRTEVEGDQVAFAKATSQEVAKSSFKPSFLTTVLETI